MKLVFAPTAPHQRILCSLSPLRTILVVALALSGMPSCESSPSLAANQGAHGKGRGGKGPGKGKGYGKDGEDTLLVPTTSLRAATIERFYETSGTLAARQQADLVAPQPGILQTIGAEEGDQVKQGKILARVDGRALSLQAAANAVALENLERELKRLESVRTGVISAEEIDKQRYAVEEARVSMQLSKHQAKQTVIRAPFSGTIVRRHVDIGTLAGTATVLFTLADLSALELELHLPERDAATVKLGTEVEIELSDRTLFVAKVERRAPIVDDLTGTVKFTAVAEDYPGAAMPGAFARARVLIDRADAAPSVERSAVFELDGKPHVFVIANGQARRVPIKLGLEGSKRFAVLEGLNAEHVVILAGNQGVTEGMRVKPAQATTSAADADQKESS